VLGCGVALVRDRLDDRLHSADEIKSSLGIPLLGAIPQMPGPLSAGDAGQHVVLQPAGEVAEAFRAVRTAACGWFTTVLGPGADSFHANNMHLDIEQHGSSGSYRICE